MQVAALEFLGRSGDKKALGVLFERLVDRNNVLQAAAGRALRIISAEGVDATILEKMKSTKGRTCAELIRILVDRRYKPATADCLTAARGADVTVGRQAIRAVRVLAGLQASELAIENFEAIFTTNALPYTREDAALLGEGGDMRPLARKHWPEAYDWLTERGYRGGWLPTVYSLEKAKRILHWEPRYNFEEWWAEHGALGA